MLAVEYFCTKKKFIFVSVKFHGDHKTAYKDDVESGHPHFGGYYQIYNSGVCLSVYTQFKADNQTSFTITPTVFKIKIFHWPIV